MNRRIFITLIATASLVGATCQQLSFQTNRSSALSTTSAATMASAHPWTRLLKSSEIVASMGVATVTNRAASARSTPTTPTIGATTVSTKPPAQSPETSAPTVPTTLPPTPPVPPESDGVTDAERAAWERTSICEEGGNWQANGPVYSGGLGVSRTNWDAYGGRQFAPDGAMATEDEQIIVAERIQPNAPDQSGCNGSW